MRKIHIFKTLVILIVFVACDIPFLSAQINKSTEGLLNQMTELKDYTAKRKSSYDTTGGNRDAIRIKRGETVVIADLKGPGMITHFWNTVNGEPFYGSKLILRMYWDNESEPSVEAPLGDFFGVGHGLDRNYSSLPFDISSEGRARNCFWQMPFRKSAKVTITNEGEQEVFSFYYYIDYRIYDKIDDNTPYFHAQYRQEMPCEPNKNYLILDAKGRGHYAGVSLSILQNAPGWWGEGDDMIYIDGESIPTFNGTGSEDYFCNAWGMQEAQSLFYGCPLQELDYETGSKASVYRFHIADPIPFTKSIKVTIEHGNINDRSDNFSSVVYWYQLEPHKKFAVLPSVKERIPYAVDLPEIKSLKWKNTAGEAGKTIYTDSISGKSVMTEDINLKKTKYYISSGESLRELFISKNTADKQIFLTLPVNEEDIYYLVVIHKKGRTFGDLKVISNGKEIGRINCYSETEGFCIDTLKENIYSKGNNNIELKVSGKNKKSEGNDLSLLDFSLLPKRNFVPEWYILGPFDNPNADAVDTPYPPEKEINIKKAYTGKDNKKISWVKGKIDKDGYFNIITAIKNYDNSAAYAFTYLYSPDDRKTKILLGSDDGIKVWINKTLVHRNPVYRGSTPDDDTAEVNLKKGWNEVLLKIIQGGGEWGFHFRVLDPKMELKTSLEK